MNSGELPDGKLREIAERLGARQAERIDVDVTARRVLERLKSARRPQRWTWSRPAWLKVAAALVVIAGAAVLVRERVPPGRPDAAAAIPIGPDLSGLSATELEELLAALEETLDLSAPPSSEPGLEQLTEEQLRTMLRSLEG